MCKHFWCKIPPPKSQFSCDDLTPQSYLDTNLIELLLLSASLLLLAILCAEQKLIWKILRGTCKRSLIVIPHSREVPVVRNHSSLILEMNLKLGGNSSSNCPEGYLANVPASTKRKSNPNILAVSSFISW